MITSQAHLDAFLSDDGAGTDLLNYVVELAESCRGTTLKDADKEAALASAGEHTRECVRAIEAALDSLSALLDEVPPAAHAMRYGNPAYRVWHDRMCGMAYEACAAALAPALREQQRGGDSTQAGSEHGNSTGEGAPGGTSSTRFESACCELRAYWCDSFGNRTRIDYGTGHETNFAAWLYCLRRTGALGGGVCDSRAVALCVFHRYLRLMRRVQTSYWLEPAGSHGVWGLDDYQFLPFVFGAAQLADHRHLRPRSIHVEMTREAVAGQYYYFEAVEFIRSVKRGSLHETSPIINDVSSLSTWARVYNGMVRMYRAEVRGAGSNGRDAAYLSFARAFSRTSRPVAC